MQKIFLLKNLIKNYKNLTVLPQAPGVYLFLDKSGAVLYAGKAKNIKNRVSSYILNTGIVFGKTRLMLSKSQKIQIIPVENEIEAFLLEAKYIKKFEPQFNSRLKDGKSFPLLEITATDTYPKVVIVKRRENKNSIYFGPYPHPGELKTVYKTLRRLFPFQSVNIHPKSPCLYYHLHLCPCPPVFDSKGLRRDYKKDIRRIIEFLKGNTKKVIKSLEKERNEYCHHEEFEKAKEVQQKINAINSITLSFRSPDEYEVNPHLIQDLRAQELTELKKTLQNFGVSIKSLERVECFDISNTSGTHATGSMVVAIHGEIIRRFYRKFKIKRIADYPDDFAMHQEVIRRRLKHQEWGTPNLIIIDGGKGQVSSVTKVLKDEGVNIPVIGIAKREETLVTPGFQEIKLLKNSKALNFVRRLRDEAHRFAITYHKVLRLRSMTV